MALDLVGRAGAELRRVKGAGNTARAVMPTARAVAKLFSSLVALASSHDIRLDEAEERALLLDHELNRGRQ